MTSPHVLPFVEPLTDEDARAYLSAGLIRTCADMGPSRVALKTGCDAKTISRARDRESTLGLACAFNLIGLPGDPLTELAAARGVRLVPLHARCDTDALVTTTAAIHHLAAARSPLSPGGATETDDELLAMGPAIDAAVEALEAVKERIIAIRERRARRGRAA